MSGWVAFGSFEHMLRKGLTLHCFPLCQKGHTAFHAGPESSPHFIYLRIHFFTRRIKEKFTERRKVTWDWRQYVKHRRTITVAPSLILANNCRNILLTTINWRNKYFNYISQTNLCRWNALCYWPHFVQDYSKSAGRQLHFPKHRNFGIL